VQTKLSQRSSSSQQSLCTLQLSLVRLQELQMGLPAPSLPSRGGAKTLRPMPSQHLSTAGSTPVSSKALSLLIRQGWQVDFPVSLSTAILQGGGEGVSPQAMIVQTAPQREQLQLLQSSLNAPQWRPLW
jgi:hypothetical protein